MNSTWMVFGIGDLWVLPAGLRDLRSLENPVCGARIHGEEYLKIDPR